MPQKDTLDRAAYTCMLVSYRRLSSQFQFSLSSVTLVYLSQWYTASSEQAPIHFAAENSISGTTVILVFLAYFCYMVVGSYWVWWPSNPDLLLYEPPPLPPCGTYRTYTLIYSKKVNFTNQYESIYLIQAASFRGQEDEDIGGLLVVGRGLHAGGHILEVNPTRPLLLPSSLL